MNKYLIFRKLKIILFLISLFSCYRVVAQSSASEKNFISPVPISLNLAKGKFKEVSEKVQNNPTYKEMRFIKVNIWECDTLFFKPKHKRTWLSNRGSQY